MVTEVIHIFPYVYFFFVIINLYVIIDLYVTGKLKKLLN